MTTLTTEILQATGITTSLLSAGALLAFNFFDIPILKSQPASRSLPSIRWFFSRGSHIFPQAALVSSGAFLCLAYTAQPAQSSGLTIAQLLKHGRVSGYLAAAVLAFAIAPFTAFAMVPHPNFDIIQLNKDLGGAASQKQKKLQRQQGLSDQQLEKSSGPPDVAGDYQSSEFKDLSGPMEKTEQESTPEQDRKARDLLEEFRWLNLVRALLMLGSGVVGLVVAAA
jgi:hypothetical protein